MGICSNNPYSILLVPPKSHRPLHDRHIGTAFHFLASTLQVRNSAELSPLTSPEHLPSIRPFPFAARELRQKSHSDGQAAAANFHFTLAHYAFDHFTARFPSFGNHVFSPASPTSSPCLPPRRSTQRWRIYHRQGRRRRNVPLEDAQVLLTGMQRTCPL